jgi:hypothetical protein
MPDQTIRPEGPVAPPPRPQTSVWAKIGGTGLAVIGTEITVGVLHPEAAESIAIADAAVPVIAALVLLTVIVRGSEQTVSRVFRLLRCVCNRPEPTAPDSPMSKPAPPAGQPSIQVTAAVGPGLNGDPASSAGNDLIASQPATPRECKVLSRRCRRRRPGSACHPARPAAAEPGSSAGENPSPGGVMP